MKHRHPMDDKRIRKQHVMRTKGDLNLHFARINTFVQKWVNEYEQLTLEQVSDMLESIREESDVASTTVTAAMISEDYV